MQGKLTPALTHVAMHVRHFDECIAFYTQYCGMQIVHERGLEDLTGQLERSKATYTTRQAWSRRRAE